MSCASPGKKTALLRGRIVAAWIALAACFAHPGARAADADPFTLRLFVSGTQGGIAEMRMPDAWRYAGTNTPLNLRFAKPGSRDNLRITAFPVPPERLARMDEAGLQALLRDLSKQVQAVAVEKNPEIRDLGSSGGKGYYIAFTDSRLVGKPDSPEDYRYMHSGVLRFGGWLAVFNVFSNSDDGIFAKDALSLMASMRWAENVRVPDDLFTKARLGTALPDGVSASEDLRCPSIQPALFYTEFNKLYGELTGRKLARGAHETLDAGGGDVGSIIYMEFDAPLSPATQSFLAGLLWGERFPTRGHPEEYFVSGKQLIIWCTAASSRVKRLSQSRLDGLLFGGR